MTWTIYPLPEHLLPPSCGCGDPLPCANDDAGYPWCRACMDHHRDAGPYGCAGITPEGEDAGMRDAPFGDPEHPYQGHEWPGPDPGYTGTGVGPNAGRYRWGVEYARFTSTAPADNE